MSYTYSVEFKDGKGWNLLFPLGRVIYHGGNTYYIGREEAQRLIGEFRRRRRRVPIKALHDGERVGYIENLRINELRLEWHPSWENLEAVQGMGFKYASPELEFGGDHPVLKALAMVARPRLGRATVVFSDDLGYYESSEDGDTVDLDELKGMGVDEFADRFEDLQRQIDALQARLDEAIRNHLQNGETVASATERAMMEMPNAYGEIWEFQKLKAVLSPDSHDQSPEIDEGIFVG